MIGQMEKFFITGPKKLAPMILLSLQRAAVVHIDPLRTEEIKGYQLSQDEETLLRRWEAVVASADHALRLLGLEPDQSVQPFAGKLEEAIGGVWHIIGKRIAFFGCLSFNKETQFSDDASGETRRFEFILMIHVGS